MLLIAHTYPTIYITNNVQRKELQSQIWQFANDDSDNQYYRDFLLNFLKSEKVEA